MNQSSVVVAWSVLLASGCGGGKQMPGNAWNVMVPEETSCPEGMVRIRGGEFAMGSNAGKANAKPERRVTVAGYCMDVTEVTVSAYRKCVKAGRCATTGLTTDPSGIGKCNWDESQRSHHPINCVDWNQAEAYCRWAGKGLPTEEQWEYAARGSEGRTYPWGEAEPNEQLCWKRDSEAGTCEVGSYGKGDTPTGLKDMAGNVGEWISSGSSRNYNVERLNDSYIHRGGAWYLHESSEIRGAYRVRIEPSVRGSFLGFRCISEKFVIIDPGTLNLGASERSPPPCGRRRLAGSEGNEMDRWFCTGSAGVSPALRATRWTDGSALRAPTSRRL